MALPSAQTGKSEFSTVLRQRIDNFFRDNNVSRKGGAVMAAKIVGGLFCYAASYAALYAVSTNAWQFLALYIVHGFTQMFLLLNIAHDGNHNAISRHSFINKALSFVFDICGINSYMWRFLHNRGHHSNINVCGEDEDVLARNVLRFSPNVPRRPIHRYQHLYVWLVYGFSIFEHILIKDFEYFFFTDYSPVKKAKHPMSEYIWLFAGKLFYFTYMLLLPVLILHRSVFLVAGAYIAMHFLVDLSVQFVFQTTHIIENSWFPRTREDFDDYTYHVLATTADYATRSWLATTFLGGLNHHVVHHLCPGVCHTHYPHLTEIVRETAREYRVPYREHPTMREAVVKHFLLLRRLATQP